MRGDDWSGILNNQISPKKSDAYKSSEEDIYTISKVNKFLKYSDNDRENSENIKSEKIDKMNYEKNREDDTIIESIEERKLSKIRYDIMQGRPSLKIKLNNFEIDCLLDTGARVNVISKDILKYIKEVKIESSMERLRCANESKLETVGKAKILTKIGERSEWVEFIVVEKITPAVIGGIELQLKFNIKLEMTKKIDEKVANYVCEIEAKFGKQTSNDERFKKAYEIFKLKKNSELYKIVEENKEIFMADNWDIGCTKLMKHTIITKGEPINIKPRRQPVNLEKKIEEAIHNLWTNDIIRKCNSPWNTPLVCVWKKEKQDIRLCLDFRQLNKVTERQAFPMPNVEEMLDTLHGTKYFSSIDLGNAYYQVELEKDSQEKTAFSTKSGQFCFNRMPFGIAAAPGTFQELMTKVLGNMKGNGAVVYLDDILIYSETLEEHFKRLNAVFKKISKAGLRINPDKCQLLKKEVKFLGHIINENGIKTDPKKIEAIQTFERPKCIKNLRSFLGICNYYRRFIKGYAIKSRVLESLCGKDKAKLIWTEQCDQAFLEMKEALTKSPILVFPDFTKDFILDTDASFDTIGAVLSQKDNNGHERVIAYGSHGMNEHERGYCITRKELLAIYYFCQHFNHYLYGRRFTLRTDHKAITFMLTTKKPITAQFQTWINYLSSLDIDIQFRKGETHANADTLSRNTCGTCTQCLTEHENPKMVE